MTFVDRFATSLQNVIDVMGKLRTKKLASKPQPIRTTQTFTNRGGHEFDGRALTCAVAERQHVGDSTFEDSRYSNRDMLTRTRITNLPVKIECRLQASYYKYRMHIYN